MSSISRLNEEQVRDAMEDTGFGEPKPGTKPDEDQQLWHDLFDDLYLEDIEDLEKYQRYYDGEEEVPWTDARYTNVFGADAPRVKSNFCEVVIEAAADRLTLKGFDVSRMPDEDMDSENADGETEEPTTADPLAPPVEGQPPAAEVDPDDPTQPPQIPGRTPPGRNGQMAEVPLPGEIPEPKDKELERIKNKIDAIKIRNKYDFLITQLHIGALVCRRSFLIVWPDEDGHAKMWFNHAGLVRVWYNENGEVEAAAKQWEQPDGSVRRNLYFRDQISKWVLTDVTNTPDLRANLDPRPGTQGRQYEWRGWVDPEDESWPLENPFERVPVFPFINKPYVSLEGVSEIHNVIPQQEAITKTLQDGMIAADYSASPQKVIASKGRPSSGWKAGPGQLWSTTDTEAKWGQLDATDMENFVNWVDMWVQHVAGTSRTPQYLFFTAGEVPSGEALKTAESGAVAKAKKKHMFFGDQHVEAMRFALQIELESEFPDDLYLCAEWEDPNTRMEKEFWEIQSKKGGLGVPNRQLQEEAGYTPQQIAEFEQQAANQTAQDIGDEMLREFMSGEGEGAKPPARSNGSGPPPPPRNAPPRPPARPTY